MRFFRFSARGGSSPTRAIPTVGNLLMLAPVRWPYLPGEKKMTRADACVLNRLAQWIAGPGAVEIVYKGVRPEDIDQLAQDAVGAEQEYCRGTDPIDESR